MIKLSIFLFSIGLLGSSVAAAELDRRCNARGIITVSNSRSVEVIKCIQIDRSLPVFRAVINKRSNGQACLYVQRWGLGETIELYETVDIEFEPDAEIYPFSRGELRLESEGENPSAWLSFDRRSKRLACFW